LAGRRIDGGSVSCDSTKKPRRFGLNTAGFIFNSASIFRGADATPIAKQLALIGYAKRGCEHDFPKIVADFGPI
jgi:hypothetical protein